MKNNTRIKIPLRNNNKFYYTYNLSNEIFTKLCKLIWNISHYFM